MIPLITLIILTSGYTYIKCNINARFKHSRLSGHEAYSNIGIYGILFTSIAWALVLLFEHVLTSNGYYLLQANADEGNSVKQFWNEQYLTIAAWLVVAHAIAAWWGTRKNGKGMSAEDSAIDLANEDELSKLIFESAINLEPIQLTLSSRKAYVGISLGQLGKDDFSKHEYIAILPLMSGYREKDTLELKLVSDYAKFYETLDKKTDEERAEALSGFRIVIPVSEIKSAAFFKPDAHAIITPQSDEKTHAPFKKRRQ